MPIALSVSNLVISHVIIIQQNYKNIPYLRSCMGQLFVISRFNTYRKLGILLPYQMNHRSTISLRIGGTGKFHFSYGIN